MSVGAIEWAFGLDLPNSGQKLTLVAICNFADDKGVAWPSQETLAKITSQSPRAVRGHLSDLEDAGWIKRTKRKKPDGSFNSDVIEIQRQILPAADSANGRKRHSPAADSAAKPSLEPSDTVTSVTVGKKRRTQLPDNWVFPDDWIEPAEAYANSKGLVGCIDWREQGVKFHAYHRSRGSPMLDWSAAWRTWYINAVKFEGNNGKRDSGNQRGSITAALNRYLAS